MNLATPHITHGLAALGLALAPAGPLLAGDSLVGDVPVVVTKTVRDTETGARAEVRYFNQVMTGGTEIYVDDAGVAQELHWDGLKGVFEVDFGPFSGTAPAEAEVFVREAVVAICPSVDADGLGTQPIEAVTATLFRVDAQCPAADKRSGQ